MSDRQDIADKRADRIELRATRSEKRADVSETRADASETRADVSHTRADTSEKSAKKGARKAKSLSYRISIALSLVAIGCSLGLFYTQQETHKSLDKQQNKIQQLEEQIRLNNNGE